MIRRTAPWRVYERFEGHISGDKGHMTLQQACTIFGFQLNDEWKKKDVKKRFQKLALKFHPDHGGTSEQFQMLKEAQHLLLTHRHDRGTDRAPPGSKTDAGGGVNFRRMNYDNLTNTIHRQTADRPEYRSFSLQDVILFLIFFSCVGGYYVYKTYTTQMRVLRSRWSYSEDAIRDDYKGKTVSETAWHPWMADSETRDRMDDIAVLQGSVRRELVDAKRKETPLVYTPWQSGGPFARHMAPAHPTATTEGEPPAEAQHPTP
ncbi:putative mitochondrial chaperone protein DNAj [Leptomonas pyrrhocoris]|uniref:Putative mitochondrial chaperone protein DNAj n=1 Tax=Leptomonas pyrrhocoris TaxID=157538 RepID=A0A0N1J524_LEPPY|nr:putative mitochondrial chaperone protein DNAj [Leptomonas pyrrhocoris]XP_015660980.1 putative mitochondrial chaperone protein DNAj [Leptomonas pyrrhocoris]KPA82540.1 putative mitochondrial chaperone protein DNAj [Leptomonas pyrrhocoris]KPA82541.1 putative mitochondrial chaperone protein DNAj [Leptomonas pyrrhocoris]|eukprot:XP_015660979.1 putative mitochondrial chaperone protein DNAj [Leptomonas pyrrhocoris]